MNYLYVAYTATWVIHLAYVASLFRRYSRLKQEMDELNKKQR
jgi:CcmD family protein